MKLPILFPGQPYIVYADDDKDERAFLSEMMRKVHSTMRIIGYDNGLELVQFLEHLEVGRQLPCCIVLDFNMPIWDGMRTLKAIKSHGAYASIPVFLYSTSQNEQDIQLAKSLGAAAFVNKAYGQKELRQACEIFASLADNAPLFKEKFLVGKRLGEE